GRGVGREGLGGGRGPLARAPARPPHARPGRPPPGTPLPSGNAPPLVGTGGRRGRGTRPQRGAARRRPRRLRRGPAPGDPGRAGGAVVDCPGSKRTAHASGAVFVHFLNRPHTTAVSEEDARCP